MKKLLLIACLIIGLSVQAQKQVFHKIHQIQKWEYDNSIDTIWIDYIVDTIKILIVYIDTSKQSYMSSPKIRRYGISDTMDYQVITLSDERVKWMWGYEVGKKEVLQQNNKILHILPNVFDKYYLDDKKQPLSKSIVRIKYNFW